MKWHNWKIWGGDRKWLNRSDTPLLNIVFVIITQATIVITFACRQGTANLLAGLSPVGLCLWEGLCLFALVVIINITRDYYQHRKEIN